MNKNSNLSNLNSNLSNFFYIIFGKYNVKDEDILKLKAVQNEPTIDFSRFGQLVKNNFYTFIIVDPDAPAGFMIHQCIYNIPQDNVKNGTIYYDYHPPLPPVGTGKHRYFCILYEQKTKIEEKLVMKEKRAFKKYRDFTKLLKVEIIPKASKFFICESP